MKEKYFNGILYRQHKGGRWISTKKYIILSHAVWNVFNPSNIITRNSGFMIHHIDGDPSNDDISNLLKVNRSEHTIIHQTSLKWNDNIDVYAKKLRALGYTYSVIASRISSKFNMTISSVTVCNYISSVLKGNRNHKNGK